MQLFEDLEEAKDQGQGEFKGKWFVHVTNHPAHAIRALTNDKPPQVQEADIDNPGRFYFDTEAEAYRAMHAYYEDHNRGHEFPYHNEFMSAHHMKGVLGSTIESQPMVFK